jgi:uroporphyrinogen decarboxylase
MTIRKPFLNVLAGEREAVPPIWLMRQAGRYLPEYQEVRAKAGGFLDLVFNPELACEVTLQPLRRFGFDAAILFSDILIVPQALNCAVRFDAGEGPKLEAIDDSFIQALTQQKFNLSVFDPVFETVSRIAEGMDAEGFDQAALIGFAGSPWTVACYMIEGGGSPDFKKALQWAAEKPDDLQTLVDALADVTAAYLIKQVAAGAEALQLFDSWAGLLTDEADFEHWVIEPTCRVIDRVRQFFPDVPIIGFPRGAGVHYRLYAEQVDIQALGLDQYVTMIKAQKYQTLMPVQGNLDPEILKTGEGLEKATEQIISALAGGPHIFNLGHGIIKETPPAHVTRLINCIRGIE